MKKTLLALAASLLAGCALSPVYQRPATPQGAAFKETAGWVQAAPADLLERGPWWTLFDDPVLNQLAASIEVNNQNVASAVAAYAQSRALVAQARATIFPTVNLNVNADRSGGGNGGAADHYRANIGSSWEPDVFGRLDAGIKGANASLQASAADLAAVRMAAQGELAANYIAIRQADATAALLAQTVSGYERLLQITDNRVKVGIAPASDKLQAESQLANARIDQLSVTRQRAQLEHAIAVLLGKAPFEFSLAAAPWQAKVPDVPLALPSTLLQRRPDIAAAERRVALANEQIGIARAAYFPNLSLSGSYGTGGSKLGDVLKASTAAWSVGATLAENIFNAGATAAKVEGAQAGLDQAVARYRQTVLSAFADVENQLSATRVLAQQQVLRQQASSAADAVEQQLQNRYRAGQVSFSEVVSAQNSALSARRALIQSQADRQATAVALIQSLGGGWKGLP